MIIYYKYKDWEQGEAVSLALSRVLKTLLSSLIKLLYLVYLIRTPREQ